MHQTHLLLLKVLEKPNMQIEAHTPTSYSSVLHNAMVIDHFREQMAHSGICIPKKEMLTHKQKMILDAEKKILETI